MYLFKERVRLWTQTGHVTHHINHNSFLFWLWEWKTAGYIKIIYILVWSIKVRISVANHHNFSYILFRLFVLRYILFGCVCVSVVRKASLKPFIQTFLLYWICAIIISDKVAHPNATNTQTHTQTNGPAPI